MRSELIKKILIILGTAGVVAVAGTSPYFLINLARAYFRSQKGKYSNEEIATGLAYLKHHDFLECKKVQGRYIVQLSKKGKKLYQKYIVGDLKISKPKRWDKRWRAVIFDIPDKKKKWARDALRWKLKQMDFYPLQKSVWVCPYDCKKEIEFLADFFNITPHIYIILAEKILDDRLLKKHFHLED